MVIVTNILPMRRLLSLSRWVLVGWSTTRKLETPKRERSSGVRQLEIRWHGPFDRVQIITIRYLTVGAAASSAATIFWSVLRLSTWPREPNLKDSRTPVKLPDQLSPARPPVPSNTSQRTHRWRDDNPALRLPSSGCSTPRPWRVPGRANVGRIWCYYVFFWNLASAS